MSLTSLNFNRLFDLADYLIDQHVGVIRYVQECPKESGGPEFFHFAAQAANTIAFSRRKNFSWAGGASADRRAAIAKAIGEAVERYCSALYEMDELPLASFESASFRCVDPSAFALYSFEQYTNRNFPFTAFERNTRIRWTKAFEPDTGEVCYVPAAMVFMPYYYDREHGEIPVAQPVSTGLACHCSYEEAAISAICEVIERDAFTITWQARLGMPRICIETLSERNRDLVKRFELAGGVVTLLNLTMDHGVTTVLSVLRMTTSDGPAMVFAASTHLDPEEAVRKSLEELAHTRHFAHYLMSLPRIDAGPNYEGIIDQDGHVQMYCYQDSIPLAEFIYGSKRQIAFDEMENASTGNRRGDLAALVHRIKSIGHSVYLSDLTTPDIESLGLAVVRANIPGFHPLCFGHRLRALGGRRLWEVPKKLGYRGITRESGDNPAPHPYP